MNRALWPVVCVSMMWMSALQAEDKPKPPPNYETAEGMLFMDNQRDCVIHYWLGGPGKTYNLVYHMGNILDRWRLTGDDRYIHGLARAMKYIAEAMDIRKEREMEIRVLGGERVARCFYRTIYLLREQGLLDEKTDARLYEYAKEDARRFNRGFERIMNNRPTPRVAGWAWMARAYPMLPDAPDMIKQATLAYNDWVEVGDTWECLPTSYTYLHLQGIVELTEALGKEKDMVAKMGPVMDRYLNRRHGHGVRGMASGWTMSGQRWREERLENPWEMDNPNPHGLYTMWATLWERFAYHFKDPRYVWIAQNYILGGFPPEEEDLPAEVKKMLERRFGHWPKRFGIEPKMPEGKPELMHFQTGNKDILDRMTLKAGWTPNHPVVAMWMHDRGDEYMHITNDGWGRLYNYCVDGSLLVGNPGKHSYCRGYTNMVHLAGVGEDFPSHQQWSYPVGRWYKASYNMNMVPLKTRSKNWVLGSTLGDEELARIHKEQYAVKASGHDPGIEGMRSLFFRRDGTWGHCYENRDGYLDLNSDVELENPSMLINPDYKGDAEAPPIVVTKDGLKVDSSAFEHSVRFALADAVLEGPEKKIQVHRMDHLDNLKFTLCLAAKKQNVGDASPAGVTYVLQGWDLPKFVSVQDVLDRKAVVVRIPVGAAMVVAFDNYKKAFNVRKDFTRFTLSFALLDQLPHITPWVKGSHNPALFNFNAKDFLPRHTKMDGYQGGITKSARVGQKGDDVFGELTMYSHYTAQTQWTRQVVLTSEGVLVVRDKLRLGDDVEDMTGGPCWRLEPHGLKSIYSEHAVGPNWVDAVSYAQAWWVKRPKRVLVKIADDGGTIFGQQQQPCPGPNTCFFGRRLFSPNKDEVFLSVLVPYDEGVHTPPEIARATKTELGEDGACEATVFGQLSVTIRHDGTWTVERKGDISKELKKK